MHENIKKNQFYKDGVRFYKYKSIYTYRNEHYLYKIDFFDVFMHFELLDMTMVLSTWD